MRFATFHPPDWMADAACRGAEAEVFYPATGASAEPAKAICAPCRVVADCLAYALGNGETWGVWGGLTVNERKALRQSGARLELAPCGTSAAYRRHLRHGEPVDPTCRGAAARAGAERMLARRHSGVA